MSELGIFLTKESRERIIESMQKEKDEIEKTIIPQLKEMLTKEEILNLLSKEEIQSLKADLKHWEERHHLLVRQLHEGPRLI